MGSASRKESAINRLLIILRSIVLETASKTSSVSAADTACMLRVCDADRSDGNCSYPAAIGLSDDFGGACPCKLGIECPAGGRLAVYTAPRRDGDAYECTLAIER